uniref:Uncharacterized protein n=1 Tax=Timema bartmani TaxID=61472 RepID=A0A7R9F280_9NEOP|nr:unnamed protein product [Timema bartmani]
MLIARKLMRNIWMSMREEGCVLMQLPYFVQKMKGNIMRWVGPGRSNTRWQEISGSTKNQMVRRTEDTWKELGVEENTWKELGVEENTWKEVGLEENTWKELGMEENTWKEVRMEDKTWKEVAQNRIGLRGNW